MKYHVAIPYYYHFYVEADSEEEAIDNAHNTVGSMGEYDEEHIFVETLKDKEPTKGTISTGHEDLDVWFSSEEND